VDKAICLGKDNIQVVYMQNRLTVNGNWKMFKMREVYNKLQ